MYTQCPHCLAVYEPTAFVLARGRGQLLCGGCGHTFDALERLSAEPIFAAAAPVPASDAPVRMVPEHVPEQGHLFEAARPESPTFAAPRPRVPLRRRNGAWWIGSGALALSLAAQIVLAQRNELAREPAWRPWLESLCGALDCDLPAWRDPSALRLAARDVRPHPSSESALVITATFRNDAPWPQAWPTLQITLSDLDGRPIAMRRFSAEEYLGAMPREEALGPGQSASATLEVQDPGKQAVAFAFEFR
jgi:predicted Zn finger-like uncharacterized protein